MMFGIILLLVYLFLGFVLANLTMEEHRPVTRIWLGGVTGLIMLMWSHVPFSFILGFNVFSHILGLLFTLGIVLALYFWQCRKLRNKGRSFVSLILGKWDQPLSKGEKMMFTVIVPLMIYSIICLFNHTIYDVNGAYYTGQCTYGDLNFHLGIITSIAEQGTFPPDYSIAPGTQLDYYFFGDSISSSLLVFGSGLRVAYLLPMFLAFLFTFMGLFILAEKIMDSAAKALLAFMLFFFNGGFGLIYFLDGLRKDPGNFTRIFTAYYETPTNYVNATAHPYTNIRWTNTIVDMMIPQRATLFGWMVVFMAIFLLYQATFNKKQKYFIFAGVVAGLLPMMHMYSYFTIGMTAIAWGIVTCIRDKFSKKIVLSWVAFGIPALGLAIPQLKIWIFGAVSGESFIAAEFNAYNETDNWVWFWVKNVGLVFILLIPAFISASKKLKAMYSAGILIFVITDFVRFQNFSYDNNKLYLMWYVFTCIIVASFMVDCYHKLEGIGGRNVLACFVVIICVSSAVFTMAREMISGFRPNSYELYSAEDVKAAEFIKENTEPDSLFACYNNHNNSIASLSGRNIFIGSGTFLASHDVDYYGKEQMLKQMYADAEFFEEKKEEYGIDYLYISRFEKHNYDIQITDYMNANYEIVYQTSEITIYDVRAGK